MRLDEYSDLPAENATLNNAQLVRFLHSARHVLVAIFLFFLGMLLIIQLSRSSPLESAVIARLTIPSQSTTGVTFQAPVNGFYIFEYAAGGFLVYNLENGEQCDRTSFECYSTAVVAFRGNTVLRRGQDISANRELFHLGAVNVGWTLEEAEETTVGQRQGVNLRAGQQITFVAADWPDAYDDNTGDILLNVYFVPK
ncbi:MAG: hypothetical protein HND48_09380 [Chloroflexi bacterium]|nr:hypothetical protein [Chloroflexota bacterium]